MCTQWTCGHKKGGVSASFIPEKWKSTLIIFSLELCFYVVLKSSRHTFSCFAWPSSKQPLNPKTCFPTRPFSTKERQGYDTGHMKTHNMVIAKANELTVFESNSWCCWAKTLSTLAASVNVTNPNPLQRQTKQNVRKQSSRNCNNKMAYKWLVSI